MTQNRTNPWRSLARRQTPTTVAVELLFLLLLLAVFWLSRGRIFPSGETPTVEPVAVVLPTAETELGTAAEAGAALSFAPPRTGEELGENCEQLVANPSFEELGGWRIPITARPAALSSEQAASGARSLRLGIDGDDEILYSDSTAFQTVQLPADARQIFFQARVLRSHSGSGKSFQYAWLTVGRETKTLFRSQEEDQQWQTVAFDLTAEAGKPVRILFGAFNTGAGGRSAMWVDDVTIYACRGTEPPSQAQPVALFLPALFRTNPLPPAATPTAPLPTVTPVPCQQLLVNGNFEGTTGWTVPATLRPASYSSQIVWSGRRSLRLGIPEAAANATSDSTAYQWVELPADARSILLRLYVWRGGTPGDRDFQYVWLNVGGRTVRVFHSLNDKRNWQEITYDLSQFAGERLMLLLGAYNNGSGGKTVMYVDGASIESCAAAGAQPAPTVSPTPTPQPTALPQPAPAPQITSPDFAVNTFLWWRPELAERDLELVRNAGFRWVRQTFAWEDIETAGKGEFDWSNADRVVRQVNESGLYLLARLGSDPALTDFWAQPPPQGTDDFVDFVAALARRYNCSPGAVGCIQAYQIWNEPNLAREWGGQPPNPAQFVDLLGKAYAAIKAANPNAIVISGGMAPTGTDSAIAMPDTKFYREMYQAMRGDSSGYFDLLGVHAAGFAAPPEINPADVAANAELGGYRFFSFRHVEDIRAIMNAFGDGDKRVAVLEFGWTSDSVNAAYMWHGAEAGIDEFVKADYLVRAFQWADANWQPWIGLMSVLTMPNLDWLEDGDPFDEEQYWWAILEPSRIDELRLRPAFIFLCDYFNGLQGEACVYAPPGGE